jgi:phosphocarrier protein
VKVQKILKIKNRLGLHVRAVTQLVKTAEPFDCEIFIDREGFEQVNGKSIMSVLTLAAPKGSKITVTTEGPDAEKALKAIEELINDNFGEED